MTCNKIWMCLVIACELFITSNYYFVYEYVQFKKNWRKLKPNMCIFNAPARKVNKRLGNENNHFYRNKSIEQRLTISKANKRRSLLMYLSGIVVVLCTQRQIGAIVSVHRALWHGTGLEHQLYNKEKTVVYLHARFYTHTSSVTALHILSLIVWDDG